MFLSLSAGLYPRPWGSSGTIRSPFSPVERACVGFAWFSPPLCCRRRCIASKIPLDPRGPMRSNSPRKDWIVVGGRGGLHEVELRSRLLFCLLPAFRVSSVAAVAFGRPGRASAHTSHRRRSRRGVVVFGATFSVSPAGRGPLIILPWILAWRSFSAPLLAPLLLAPRGPGRRVPGISASQVGFSQVVARHLAHRCPPQDCLCQLVCQFVSCIVCLSVCQSVCQSCK